jgi:predicted oxidoreductase
MAWSPLGGGELFSSKNSGLRAQMQALGEAHNTDEAAVAIAWLLHHPANIMPVLGTNNLDRIGKISDALKVPMDRQTWFELYTQALGHEVA